MWLLHDRQVERTGVRYLFKQEDDPLRQLILFKEHETGAMSLREFRINTIIRKIYLSGEEVDLIKDLR